VTAEADIDRPAIPQAETHQVPKVNALEVLACRTEDGERKAVRDVIGDGVDDGGLLRHAPKHRATSTGDSRQLESSTLLDK
jgi:hypothetical protein